MRLIFFVLLLFSLGCFSSPEPPPVEEPEVVVTGYLKTSLIQKRNTHEYFLRVDTVKNVNAPVETPESPYEIRSSVITGTIIGIK